MNVIEILHSAGIDPKRAAATSGGEWASPCPACGGSDRFRTWPDRGRFWCRSCDAKGDEIDLIRLVRPGMTYPEACAALRIEPKERHNVQAIRHNVPTWTPQPAEIPSEAWRSKAERFVAWCHDRLLENTEILEWLERARGIDRKAIEAAGLGWNPADAWRDRPEWGLPEELNAEGKPKRLWLPAGLVIPAYAPDGKLMRVRVRRPEGEPRYVVVAGSSNMPLVCGESGPVVIVESELDALLIGSKVPGVLVVALGSASIRPDRETTAAIESAAALLVSLDADSAGGKAAWNFWGQNFPQAKRWPVPAGKDPTEAFTLGLDLAAWIAAGVGSPMARCANE